MKRQTFTFALLACMMLMLSGRSLTAADAAPNIVVVLADDMGYGDVQALNESSAIPTPNLNKLAADGLTFTGRSFAIGGVYAYTLRAFDRPLLLAK